MTTTNNEMRVIKVSANEWAKIESRVEEVLTDKANENETSCPSVEIECEIEVDGEIIVCDVYAEGEFDTYLDGNDEGDEFIAYDFEKADIEVYANIYNEEDELEEVIIQCA